MTNANRSDSRRRAVGIAGALVVQCVFAALLAVGLAVQDAGIPAQKPVEAVTTVDLPPPAPEPERQAAPDAAPSRAPAPAGREGEALPVEAPPAAIAIDPVPAASTAGEGPDRIAGSGTAGPGAGAGGTGIGDGGGGGIATPARRIAGALRDSDYPRAAERERLAGTVAISFRVRTDGRVDRCTVLRSSGHALLDELTCTLFTERYRFRPATTATGRPVESILQTTFTWGTRRR